MKIPNSIESWAKTLIGGAVSGGANALLSSLGLAAGAAVGLPVHQLSPSQMLDIFATGAIVGAVMFLAKSPVPPDDSSSPPAAPVPGAPAGINK